jgi:hypothetical protein
LKRTARCRLFGVVKRKRLGGRRHEKQFKPFANPVSIRHFSAAELHLSKIFIMRNLIALLSLIFAFPISNLSASNAYNDPDSTRTRDTLIVKYRLASDLNITAGNLNSINSINNGQLDLEQRILGIRAMAGYRYGILEGDKNAEEFTSAIALNLFPKNRVYGFVNGGVESSFLRAFDFRGFAGAGASFRVLRSEDQKFEPFVNFLYEYTDFNAPILVQGDSTEILQVFRAVLGWTGTHKLFKQKLIITHNSRFQQSLQDLDNFRFEGGINFLMPVFKILSFRTGLSYTYENVVITGRQKTDFIWTFGVLLSNI